MAGAPAHAQTERRGHLLGHGRLVDHAAIVELEPLTAALVDRVVARNRIRMLAAEPLEAEAVADLLVGHRRKDQIAARAKALARERGDRHRARGHLALHVERTAPPDLTIP